MERMLRAAVSFSSIVLSVSAMTYKGTNDKIGDESEKPWEQPRQVNLLGTILCVIQCKSAGWDEVPGTLLPYTDCKFQGHFSTVWAVCCLYSNGQAAFRDWKEPIESACHKMGWDEGSVQ
jgi:hypothetical protein